VQGDFAGNLGPLHLKLHLINLPDGSRRGTLDSPDQGASGIPCADIVVSGSALSFSVPAVHGSWKGTIDDNGATLAGTWNQGSPMALTFSREVVATSSTPLPVSGFWLGTLQGPGLPTLRIQLTVTNDSAGQIVCTVDSLDQGAYGATCAGASYTGDRFSFDVPSVHGHWLGSVSPDGQTLTGTWDEGKPSPLNFERHATAQTPPTITHSGAMAPVGVKDIQAVLTQDLKIALQTGPLAPNTSAGWVVGVVQHGVRRVLAFGTAKPDSIFEIGSITKTFTGLLLAQAVAQGRVRLDEPVRDLLPAGTVTKPQGAEITLLDLVTQHSGLPRMPENFHPANRDNPYADYDRKQLYQFLGQRGVEKPAAPPYLYSNLGVGLLGQVLANQAHTSYAKLLAMHITQPLMLRDTVVSLTPAQQGRFIAGHSPNYQVAHAWDLDAFSGAGAIRSTAGDMLTYLEAQLHPDRAGSGNSAAARTLKAAIEQTHELRADALPGQRIAFAWMFVAETGEYWHNGATGGYSSYAFFNPTEDYAGVVLLNRTVGGQRSLADLLGQHVSQRLTGRPAIAMSDW
jgi:CubicO group peptidase (beta-lactamase class C family)